MCISASDFFDNAFKSVFFMLNQKKYLEPPQEINRFLFRKKEKNDIKHKLNIKRKEKSYIVFTNS